MIKKLLHTNNSMNPFILRIFLAIVIFPHGAQKLLGWFGGYGFSGTMDFFTSTVGLPWFIGFIVILLETLGAIALLIGLGTRIFAILLSLLAIGIIYTSHLSYGFFMNWFGNQAGEGYEFFLLWIGISLALVISGGGKFSLDSKVTEKL